MKHRLASPRTKPRPERKALPLSSVFTLALAALVLVVGAFLYWKNSSPSPSSPSTTPSPSTTRATTTAPLTPAPASTPSSPAATSPTASTRATTTTASLPTTPPTPLAPRIRVLASNVVPTPANDPSLASHIEILREERRDLSESFLRIGNSIRDGAPPPSEIEFPLFDGNTVTLTDFKLIPFAPKNEGVFSAKVKGVETTHHVFLSYVNNTLNGEIHVPAAVPAASRYYEIRNAATPAGADITRTFLAQIDPSRLKCGECSPRKVTVNLTPVKPASPATAASGK